ncbi:MAG: hypothetical protein FWD39_06370 [Clostridiales bacterium]|nr:hypothetical protein [Clostridiales bacterium]
MKKLLITALMLALIFALAGCTENPSSQEPPPLSEPISFNTLYEIMTFVNETDQDKYEAGKYKNMIEIIKKNGFLLEAQYKGEPLQTYEVKGKENTFDLFYNTKYKYTSYRRQFETKEGVIGSLTVYYIEEANIEDARENPYRYFAASFREDSLEQVLSYGLKRKELTVSGKEINAFQSPFGLTNNPNDDFEWMVFSWEDKFVVQVYFYKNDKGFGTEDFVKDLTFEMIPLKKGE